jgi:acetyltransferase-like isoleucine patch superfamily enzyme
MRVFITINTYIETLKAGFVGLKMSFFSSRKDRYGYFDKTSSIMTPVWGVKQNVYIYDHCGINADAKFICQAGKFVMKSNCSVGPGLTVITCNHKYRKVSQRPESDTWGELESYDVIVNEDVWIGANVTLCPGTVIGRGSIIAAGSVCIKNKDYPPYTIIGGNPAKFIKFRLSLSEQLQQEKLFYNESAKISESELINNWSNLNRN